MNRKFILKKSPAGVVLRTDENYGVLSIIKWSGRQPIPNLGDRVCVFMNDLGYGEVTGFFVSSGYLGVEVYLENPPVWFVIQNDGNIPVLVYGSELR